MEASCPAQAVIGVKIRESVGREVYIEEVIPGSPADAADLESMSTILRVDGREVSSYGDFANIMKSHEPGKAIRLVIADFYSDAKREIMVGTVAKGTVFRAPALSPEALDAIEEVKDKSDSALYATRLAGKPLIAVGIGADSLSNITLERLSHLPRLECLKVNLDRPSSWDVQGWEALTRSPRLKQLEFSGSECSISAELLAVLAKFPHLRVLRIDRGRLDDAAVDKLGELTQLTQLRIAHTAISGEVLTSLARLSLLEVLELQDSGISGVNLHHLSALANLQLLDLSNDLIGDTHLAALGRLTELQHLDLDGTQVTDQGFDHLKPLKRLEFLSLNYTGDFTNDSRYPRYIQDGHAYYSTRDVISIDKLKELVSELPVLTELEVRGPEYEPARVRELGRLIPNARIYTSAKNVIPTERE